MANAPTPPPSGRDTKEQAKGDLAAAKASVKAERPLWKRSWWVAATITIAILAGAGCDVDTADTAGGSNEGASFDDGGESTDTEEAESDLTSGQENALRSAEDYLSLQGFSRSGLIEQLEFEGYSTKDAAFAVDFLNVNWNEQAARSAEDYLSLQGFSRSGLIEQLEFEGYTRKQAEYGADKAL